MIQRWAGMCMLVLAMNAGVAHAAADEGRFAPDAEIREAFDEVVRDIRPSVVEFSADGRKKVLGTIVDKEGYVLSKASELLGHDKITAKLFDGREARATIVGVDRMNDLVMLKVNADKLRAVTLEKAEQKIGRWVACVSQDRSPEAVGIVSAKARVVKPPQLVLGVILREDPRGLRVMALSAGFGADKAGVRTDDVLTHVDGKKVIAVQQVIDRLQGFADGDEVEIRIFRGDETKRLKIGLSELEPDPRSRSERMNRMGGAISERRRGFERIVQHDAELRPEHCGGPLVNLKGEVIGLNIARAGRIETYALPSSLLSRKIVALKSGRLAPENPDGDAQAVKAAKPDPADAEQ